MLDGILTRNRYKPFNQAPPRYPRSSLHWTTSKWLGAPVSSFTYCSLLVTLSHRVSRICALTIPILSPAPEHGFEPQLTESESVVLPLDDSGIRCYKSPIPVTLRCLLVGNEMFYYWTNRAVVPVAYSSNSNPERIPTALAGNKRERMRRIELPQSAWKAEALPLCNIRIATSDASETSTVAALDWLKLFTAPPMKLVSWLPSGGAGGSRTHTTFQVMSLVRHRFSIRAST